MVNTKKSLFSSQIQKEFKKSHRENLKDEVVGEFLMAFKEKIIEV